MASIGLEPQKKEKVTYLQNQPYDEVVEVSSLEDAETQEKNIDALSDEEIERSSVNENPETNEPVSHGLLAPPRPLPSARVQGLEKPESDDGSQNSQEGDEDDDEDDDDDDEEEEAEIQVEGQYDPSDYENLSVSAEMKELFQYITRYTPQTIELEHKLKPFIPDFIPAVGDIDAFLKVPRPDNKDEKLGFYALDEPRAKQSDPTVLDLQLRAVTKETTTKTTAVKRLTNADKNTKEIDTWINSIGQLHRSKPPPTVHYAKNMPDIDSLMQEWPPEFEEMLKEVGLPSAEIECSLEDYVEIVCSL